MKGKIISLPRLHEAEKNANHHVPTYSIQTRNASIPPRSTPLPPMLVRQALAPDHSAPTRANRTGATSAKALDASCRTMFRYWGPWAQGNEAEVSLTQCLCCGCGVCVCRGHGCGETRANVGTGRVQSKLCVVYARKDGATETLCNNIQLARTFPASCSCALAFFGVFFRVTSHARTPHCIA
jgi:hypothetical protein